MLLALGVLSGACTADFALSSGARVACSEGGGCPPGSVCNAVGRCERTDSLDRVAPELTDGVRVEPSVGTTSTRFEVSFGASPWGALRS